MIDTLGPLGTVRFEFSTGEVIVGAFHQLVIDALASGTPVTIETGPCGTIYAIHRTLELTTVKVQC